MIYILLFICSFTLTYLIKEYAIKNALLDEINERSSHTVPTPHGGGIAIALTWFGGLTYLFIDQQIDPSLFYALMTGTIISIVSYFDDLYELSAKFRLITQTLVSFLGLYFLGGVNTLDFFFFTIENPILNNIFGFFIILWFINLYNFLDGIDGYAGGEAIFLALAGFILFGGSHFLVLTVAIFGFLLWNWHPAKIFMGDVGSTLLGYTVAIFTIYYANELPSNLWIWVTLFGLFWVDATLTLLRRYKNKEKLSQAHKKHAYQRLHQSGWEHHKIVILSILVNIVLLTLVYFIPYSIFAFIISLPLLYTIVTFIDKEKNFNE